MNRASWKISVERPESSALDESITYGHHFLPPGIHVLGFWILSDDFSLNVILHS